MLFGIEFSQRLHQQLVNVRVVLLFLQQVAVDSRGSHTCALVTTLCLGCKAIVKHNPASIGCRRSHSALDQISKFRPKLDLKNS